ncbi:hypothetical protein H4I96_10222 [Botrytis cinerea]
MVRAGDKGEEKSKFRKSLKESRSTIAPEFESESRPQSSFISFSTGIESQSSAAGNSDLDKIEDPYQEDSEDSSSLLLTPTSIAEFVTESDSQSIHQISAKTEIDHGTTSGKGTDANHEAETASQAAAHLDSLDPMNPSVEQDDATRNASIRATINGLQNSTITERGGTNGTANATATVFVDITSHVLLKAINNVTNATMKALMNATAQA